MSSSHRSQSLWRHRLPLLLLATLSVVALGLSFLAGFSCSFLSVSSTTATTDLQEGGSLGIFCPADGGSGGNASDEAGVGVGVDGDSFDGGGTGTANSGNSSSSSSGTEADAMTTLSRTFLSLSWIAAVGAALLAAVLTFFVPPTDATYRALSILSGLASILSVPSFLLLESNTCKISGNACGLHVGAFYLIVAATLQAIISAYTALTAHPAQYYEVKENWTVGRKGGAIQRTLDGVGDALEQLQYKIQQRRDWRLRYVDTEEGDGEGEVGGLERYGLMDESGDVGEGEDDDAREMREDGNLLDHLEAGEFTGLTIEYESGVEDGATVTGGTGGGAREAAAIAGGAAAVAIGGAAAAYAATRRRDSQQSCQDPPGNVPTMLERSGGETTAASAVPALVTPTSLGATAEYPPVGAYHGSEEEQSSIDGDDRGDSSMYTTTDDEASKMVQLQTSRLDEIGVGGDLGVIYKDRPPAYDMDSPHVIDDEHRAAMEQAKLDHDRQYYADEDALAPPSDAEENRLMVSNVVDDDSDVPDNDGNIDDDDGLRAKAGGTLTSSKSLRDKSRSLRTSLQALGRKISDNVTVDDGRSIRNLGGKAAYVAMDASSDEGNGRRSSVDPPGSSSSDSSEQLSQFCDELEKGSQARTQSQETSIVEDDDISADADDEHTDDEAGDGIIVREEGGIAFVRVDSDLSNLSRRSRAASIISASAAAAKSQSLDRSSENSNGEVSSLIEEALGAAVDTSGELSPPPPPPPEEPQETQSQDEKYADPPLMYYPSSSEAEESDADLSAVMSLGDEEMPEDELEAYTSDGGSSLSSYASDDNSSVSSYGGSEDEKEASAVIAGVLEEKKRKKKKSRKGGNRGPDGRRRRRRKKKRSRRFSSNRSIGSQSLLDETIEEETDMDLRAMEDSSEDDKSMQNNTTILEDPHGLLPTDGLIAGAGGLGEDAILNTIVETSFTKDGAIEEGEEDDEHKDRKDGYESGYLTRSPAPSDSESKLDFIRKAVTPSPSPRKSTSSYRSLTNDDDAAYYSAPEGNDTLYTSYTSRSPVIVGKSEDKNYASDTGKIPQSQSQECDRSAITVSDSSIDGDDSRSLIVASDVLTKPVEMTRSRSNLSLPPTLQQNRPHAANDDSSVDGSVTSAIYRYEMPTSWKAEKKNRSPLHNTDTYFSDSSSNTDSSRSARTSASRQARIARKKRLSMGGGATTMTSRARSRAVIPRGQSRMRSSTLEPPVNRKSLATARLSNRHYSPRKEKLPMRSVKRSDILAELEGALHEL